MSAIEDKIKIKEHRSAQPKITFQTEIGEASAPSPPRMRPKDTVAIQERKKIRLQERNNRELHLG